MSEMRIRPKSDYMHTASFEQLFALTEHWKSDLDFYKGEIDFLAHLINKYFIWMTKEENIEKVRALSAKLESTKKLRDVIAARADKHLSDIEALLENPFSHDEQTFRDAHGQLEDELAAFVKDFRKIKKDVFNISEHVIDEEKLQNILSA